MNDVVAELIETYLFMVENELFTDDVDGEMRKEMYRNEIKQYLDVGI